MPLNFFNTKSKKKPATPSLDTASSLPSSPTKEAQSPSSSPEKRHSSDKDKDRHRRGSSRRSPTKQKPPAKPSFARASAAHKYDPDSHPLNLPPEEHKRLSVISAMSDQPSPTPMDVDRDSDSASPAPASPALPPIKNPKVQRANTNGTNGATTPMDQDEEMGPRPPPHRAVTSPPPVVKPPADPEQFKVAGNKFFKAKEYEKAISEYSKG